MLGKSFEPLVGGSCTESLRPADGRPARYTSSSEQPGPNQFAEHICSTNREFKNDLLLTVPMDPSITKSKCMHRFVPREGSTVTVTTTSIESLWYSTHPNISPCAREFPLSSYVRFR